MASKMSIELAPLLFGDYNWSRTYPISI